MKKFLYILILVVMTIGTFSPIMKINAQTTTGYQLLAPLPCDPSASPAVVGCDSTTKTIKSFDPSQPNNLRAYLNLMIKIFIGICAVLSVVMIVIGGLEYMTSELVHSKEAGKERIEHAIFGLIIALGAYALLFTINPDLLNNPPAVTAPAAPAGGVTAGTTPSATSGTTTNPVLPVAPLVTSVTNNWYFEYKSAPLNGVNTISRPYNSQADCQTAQGISLYPSLPMVRGCFQSTNTPSPSP